jgi:diguanylate cyclase (GGDEF)-like protein
MEERLLADDRTSIDVALLGHIKRHLEGLKRTADGALLYGLIERGLRRYGAESGKIELAFIRFLHTLLGRYVGDRASDPTTRFKAKVIQQYIAPLLPAGVRLSPAAPSPGMIPGIPADRRRGMEEQQAKLAQQVSEAITHNKEVDALIKTNLMNLQQPDAVNNLDDLKSMLISGLEELVQGQKALRENLQNTQDYLKEVEQDRRALQEALGNAHKSKLVDGVTGLPNRGVFIKQLDAEVARARRYGFDLAVALMVVDDLHALTGRLGAAAGELIIQYYANKVLSLFRGYDMTARSASDEFAVLFPNTHREGAMRAVKKAQHSMDGAVVQYRGQDIAVPGFSCALTLYSPGETADTLMRRTQFGMDQIKGGPNKLLAV